MVDMMWFGGGCRRIVDANSSILCFGIRVYRSHNSKQSKSLISVDRKIKPSSVDVQVVVFSINLADN